MATYLSSYKPSKYDEQDMLGSTGEVRMSDQQELTFITSVWTLDVILRTCQEQWPVKTDNKRVKGICTEFDDDDELRIYGSKR